MQCSAGAVQCLQIFCGAVQRADRTLTVRVQCSKSVRATSPVSGSELCHMVAIVLKFNEFCLHLTEFNLSSFFAA